MGCAHMRLTSSVILHPLRFTGCTPHVLHTWSPFCPHWAPWRCCRHFLILLSLTRAHICLFVCLVFIVFSPISQIAQTISHSDWFTHYSCVERWVSFPKGSVGQHYSAWGWGGGHSGNVELLVSLDRSSIKTMPDLFVSKYCPLRWGWLLYLWLEILNGHDLTVLKIKTSPNFSHFVKMSNSTRLPCSLRSLRTLPLFQLVVDKLGFAQALNWHVGCLRRACSDGTLQLVHWQGPWVMKGLLELGGVKATFCGSV